MCRQLWLDEKKVLSGRIEEYQSHQEALAGQLADANRKSKRVCLFLCLHWKLVYIQIIQALNHYRKRVQELQQSVEVLKAREEEVKTEKEAVK